jgi:hypothetical protein
MPWLLAWACQVGLDCQRACRQAHQVEADPQLQADLVEAVQEAVVAQEAVVPSLQERVVAVLVEAELSLYFHHLVVEVLQ